MDSYFVHIGQFHGWGEDHPVALSREDRRRHLYIIGQTGTGKSTLIRHLLAQDIQNGEGCALIDPHGDLPLEVLDTVPSRRVDDVIVLDPSDTGRPVGLNPFYRVPADDRAMVAADITAAFKHIWRDSWGARLEYILLNTITALLDAPDKFRPTFAAIPLFLADQYYREQVLGHLKNRQAKTFFEGEFSRWNSRQVSEALGPVQNKIGQLLHNPFVCNILGQWKPSINLSQIIEKKRILIVRLSKGTLGEVPSNLLGSLVASGFAQNSMQRTAIPEDQRHDFHLHIDEFQNFTTDSFAAMFSESRKYGLTLTIGNQYLDQLDREVRAAVFGNVGNIVSFRVSASDADVLAKEIGRYQPSFYKGMEVGKICARVLRKGEVMEGRIGRTLRDAYSTYKHRANILKQSRQRYGEDRGQVEEKFSRWLRAQL
ncbi:MAG: hypothetical protein C0605_05370 [Hyphomicrobiales bacterium]|nr:MAG: hypothetical protein C0605_05370 [Hyphomicrobiales bacterium]